MTRWLLETGCLELLNVALFSWLYLRLARPLGAGDASLLGLLTLDAVLLEGGCYWLGKYWLIRKRRSGRGNPQVRLRAIQVLYAVNVTLLLVFPLTVLVGVTTGGNGSDATGLVLGVALYALAAGEFVHYFLWKVNMRSSERALARRGARRVTARFLRELRRAQAAVAELRQADDRNERLAGARESPG